MVGCAFLLFVASIVWYANRSVEITLNGEAAKVRINSSIERVIREKELEPRPGNLLAVDDSVLEKGGGTACTVELNGKAIDNDHLDEVELTAARSSRSVTARTSTRSMTSRRPSSSPRLPSTGRCAAFRADMGRARSFRGLGPVKRPASWPIGALSRMW